MGNASSLFDCAVNPLNPLPGDEEEEDEDALNAPPAGLLALGEAGAGDGALAAPTPLRDSFLWRLQRAFYEQSGPRAWTEGVVPNFVSSNSFIARAYAKIAIGLMRDAARASAAAGAGSPPVLTILEVGAGHGKLGYLIVESLLRFRAFLPPRADGALPFRYVLTDVCAANVEAMRAHPSLRDFVAQGIVDVAVWDAEEGLSVADGGAAIASPSLRLLASGATLSSTTLAGAPLLVVANYVLNSLRTDAFRVPGGGAGGLEQALTSLVAAPGSRVPLRAATAAAELERAEVADAAGVVPTSTSAADMLARLSVKWGYTRGGMVLIPLGGLAMLRSLLALSGGRLVALLGDKGHSYLAEMADGGRDPHVASHGCVSFMVNFHAVRQWARSHGGVAVMSPQAEGFKTCVLMFEPGSAGSASSPAPRLELRASTFPAPAPCVQRGAVATETYGGMLATVAHTLDSMAAAAAAGPSFARGSEPLVTPLSLSPGAAAAAMHPVLAPAGCLLPAYPLSAFGNGMVAEASTGVRAAPRPDSELAPGPGGFAIDDDEVDASVSDGGFGGGFGVGASSSSYADTRAAAAEVLVGFTAEDFATMQRGIKEECPPSASAPSLKHVLSLLRLSQHDSEVFLKFKQVLIDRTVVPTCPENVAKDVRFDVERLYAGYFPLQASHDVCFELARVCMGMRDHAAAVEFFSKSSELCGQHHVTFHNMGICYYFINDRASAQACFRQALGLRPDYTESRHWLAKVAALEGQVAVAATVAAEGESAAEGEGEGVAEGGDEVAGSADASAVAVDVEETR